MKVKSIVEKTKEFEKLGGMIKNIEEVIEAVKNPKPETATAANSILIFPRLSFECSGSDTELKEEAVEYMSADLLIVMERKVKELKKEQDNLEV